MTEIDTTIQSAIWELVTTEVDYIHALQTVTDVSALKNPPLLRKTFSFQY